MVFFLKGKLYSFKAKVESKVAKGAEAPAGGVI
jgi:hypothetical protein